MAAQPHRHCRSTAVAVFCLSGLLCGSVGAFASPSIFGRMVVSKHSLMSASAKSGGGGAGDDEENAGATATATKSSDSIGTYNPLRLAVLKLGLTELRWTSPLNYEKREGFYNCANCGTRLFDSQGKYDSGSGWPSFFRTAEGNVALYREWDGRIECRCATCQGHLGHVFPDGPRRRDVGDDEVGEDDVLRSIPESDLTVGDPSNSNSRLPRYCMNGASLKFEYSNDA